jgi:hypothetical protein
MGKFPQTPLERKGGVQGVLLYHTGWFQEAAGLFQECLEYYEGDRATQIYLDRCLKS